MYSPQQAASLLSDQIWLDELDWNAIRSILEANPRAASFLQFPNKYNILHFACGNKAPLSVVQLLVQQLPDAVREKTTDGELPLHVACEYKQSFEVIQLLIRKYPDALKEKNRIGYLPLHWACEHAQSLEVIQLLVQHHPNAIKEKDSKGWLPLHRACGYKQSLEVIQYLVQQLPNTVRDKGDYQQGWLPLHTACAMKQSLEVVQFLVQQDPDTVRKRDDRGLLPLHRACAHRQSLKVIQYLVQQHPNSLEVMNDQRQTPLDLANRTINDENPDPKTVEWLEAVNSGRIILPKLPPAPSRCGERKTDGPCPLAAVVEKDLAKLPTADFNDKEIAVDRCSVLAVLVGKKDIAAVSPSYIESIRTKEIIGNGVFGTVFKGTDTNLRRSFAIKAINTDRLSSGNSAEVEKAAGSFLKEIQVRRSSLCVL
jgi:ankyrin repeat protein